MLPFSKFSKQGLFKRLPASRNQFHVIPKLRTQSPPLVILSPREARIVPKRQNRQSPLVTKNQLIPNDYIHKTPTDVKDAISDSVINAIDDLKPRTQPTTSRTLKEKVNALNTGFTHANLKQYITSKSLKPEKLYKFKKMNTIQYILKTVWECQLSQETDDLIENRISLSPKDFVLILGDSGSLLREFSKSGAQISLWPAKHQILVLSSVETFKWIQTRLTLFLESVYTVKFDLNSLQPQLFNPEKLEDEIRAIQQITDSYIEHSKDKLVIYTAGSSRKHNSMKVVRLIYSLIDKSLELEKGASVYYTDEISANTECNLHPFDDRNAFEWYNKLYNWCRLETVKTKASNEPGLSKNNLKNNLKTNSDDEVCLKEFRMPKFTELDASASTKSSLQTQLDQVVEELVRSPLSESLNSEPVTRTVTSSFGYLLYKNNGELSPNAAMDRVFATTVPNVTKYAGTLPFFDNDVAEEAEEAEEVQEVPGAQEAQEVKIEDVQESPEVPEVPESPESPESSESPEVQEVQEVDTQEVAVEDASEEKKEDVWDIWQDRVFTTRRKEQEFNMSTKYVSARYIPNPNFVDVQKYPSIDAWIPVNDTAGSEVRLLALPKQQNAYISLPNLPTDLQFAVIDSYSVPNTPETDAFFDVFRKTKMRYGLDQKLVINFNGVDVEYVCSNYNTVEVSELQFENQLLQLLNINSEFHKKTEATVVSEDAKELVETTVKFINAVEQNI